MKLNKSSIALRNSFLQLDAGMASYQLLISRRGIEKIPWGMPVTNRLLEKKIDWEPIS